MEELSKYSAGSAPFPTSFHHSQMMALIFPPSSPLTYSVMPVSFLLTRRTSSATSFAPSGALCRSGDLSSAPRAWFLPLGRFWHLSIRSFWFFCQRPIRTHLLRLLPLRVISIWLRPSGVRRFCGLCRFGLYRGLDRRLTADQLFLDPLYGPLLRGGY